MDENLPIFLQIAAHLESDILSGTLHEHAQVPSTNEFAAFHRINPATAGRGINLLVDEGVLYKKRGVGMFVAPGARERLVQKHRARFPGDYIVPLVAEAEKLGIPDSQLIEMIAREHADEGGEPA